MTDWKLEADLGIPKTTVSEILIQYLGMKSVVAKFILWLLLPEQIKHHVAVANDLIPTKDFAEYVEQWKRHWERYVRSQGAYVEGGYDVIFLCTMFLLSCIFFNKFLYFSNYMAGNLLDRSRIRLHMSQILSACHSDFIPHKFIHDFLCRTTVDFHSLHRK